MMFICKEWLWGAKFPGAGQGNQCLPFGVSVVAVCSLVVLLLHMLLLSFFHFLCVWPGIYLRLDAAEATSGACLADRRACWCQACLQTVVVLGARDHHAGFPLHSVRCCALIVAGHGS